MAVLSGLEPQAVFHFFEALCAIPHGSGNTKAVSDWCAAFARARGLEYHQDALHNIILIKEAAPGYEGAEPVVLQGHLDMVCEKEPGCPKDLDREGLDLEVDGDFITARGTTLGGDDGIAAAMCLALLDAGDIPHPRLEVVLTVDEEVGMLGAAALDVSPLRGRTLINLDSEAEGVFTVSCAGGNRTRCLLPVRREPFGGSGLRVTAGGLAGGHSGTEIHRGRANASMLLGRALRAAGRAAQVRLVWAAGGGKDNAIPTESWAQIATSDPAAVRRALEDLEGELRREYRTADPVLFLKAEDCPAGETPMDAESTRRAVCMLTCLPNGVQAMSGEIPGLVQTSLNLGILETAEEALSACFSVRSALGSQKEALKDRLACLMEELGGTVEYSGDYPAWEYREESPLRERMVQVFREQYGREPRIEAIHAGVECGLLAGKLPGLDCVSIGPDLLEIHTPRERMSIPSVQRVWVFLLEVLKRSK